MPSSPRPTSTSPMTPLLCFISPVSYHHITSRKIAAVQAIAGDRYDLISSCKTSSQILCNYFASPSPPHLHLTIDPSSSSRHDLASNPSPPRLQQTTAPPPHLAHPPTLHRAPLRLTSTSPSTILLPNFCQPSTILQFKQLLGSPTGLALRFLDLPFITFRL